MKKVMAKFKLKNEIISYIVQLKSKTVIILSECLKLSDFMLFVMIYH